MRAADRVTLRKKVVEWMFPSRLLLTRCHQDPFNSSSGPSSVLSSPVSLHSYRDPQKRFPPLRSLPLSAITTHPRPTGANTAPTISPFQLHPPTPPPPLPLFCFPGLLFGSRPNFSQATPHHPRVTFAAGSSLSFHYVVDKARYAHGPARYTGYAHGMGVGRPTNIGRVRG